MEKQTLVWAHRGASGYAPENTLEAFQKAVEMGADGVELNMALEDAFGVSIPDEELANMKTVGDIFNYLTAHAEA